MRKLFFLRNKREYITNKLYANFSQLKRPSLRTATTSIYMQAPKVLEEATRPNLTKLISELVQEGEFITVTDAALPVSLQLGIKWKA